MKGLYAIIFIFLLVGYYDLLFLNEEFIIAIALVLYFFALFSSLRKVVLVYFFSGTEMLYVLLYLLVTLNIIYINTINAFFTMCYSYISVRVATLVTLFHLEYLSNYYYFDSYYNLIFFNFIYLLRTKELSDLEILDDTIEPNQAKSLFDYSKVRFISVMHLNNVRDFVNDLTVSYVS